MKLPMTALASYSMFTASSFGVSGPAQFVQNCRQMLQGRMHESRALGAVASLNDLQTLANETSLAGWDGYSAVPVSKQSVNYAANFLRAMSLGGSFPSVSADANGWVVLEWYRSPYWTLSVSVTADGLLHYAALFGSDRVFGTTSFSGEIPREIIRLVNRVMTA